LRLVLRLKGHQVHKIGGPARKALFILGDTLGNLTRLDIGVCDMGNKFLTADGETENGRGIGAAHNIDLWALRVEMPTQLEEIGKTISVVGMHVCEEHRTDLRRWNIELRQSHRCAAARIELHFDSTAIVGVVAIAH
jgi:hypothetical protein